jgi:hypothetical protein
VTTIPEHYSGSWTQTNAVSADTLSGTGADRRPQQRQRAAHSLLALTPTIARRVRYTVTAANDAPRRGAAQAREALGLLLPALKDDDPLIDWAAVCVSEFITRAQTSNSSVPIACEVRLDDEHLYLAVEGGASTGQLGNGTDSDLARVISQASGSYTSANGETRTMWTATAIGNAASPVQTRADNATKAQNAMPL